MGGNAFAQQAQTAADKAKEEQAAQQAEQLSQQIRFEERKSDFEVSGLKWIPWYNAGKNVQTFIAEREEHIKTLIGDGYHVDAAIYDIDANGQPDVVLYFWDHCGIQGCLFKVYYDNKDNKPQDLFGWDFIPYKKGVMLDHTYFSL